MPALPEVVTVLGQCPVSQGYRPVNRLPGHLLEPCSAELMESRAFTSEAASGARSAAAIGTAAVPPRSPADRILAMLPTHGGRPAGSQELWVPPRLPWDPTAFSVSE